STAPASVRTSVSDMCRTLPPCRARYLRAHVPVRRPPAALSRACVERDAVADRPRRRRPNTPGAPPGSHIRDRRRAVRRGALRASRAEARTDPPSAPRRAVLGLPVLQRRRELPRLVREHRARAAAHAAG